MNDKQVETPIPAVHVVHRRVCSAMISGSNQKALQPSWSRSRRAAIVMVDNRNAITRWRDGFGEMAGRGVGLAGELAQYRYVRVARIMLEAAFRTDHDLP